MVRFNGLAAPGRRCFTTKSSSGANFVTHFRDIVHQNKQDSKRLVLIENLSNDKIGRNCITNDHLKKWLGTEVKQSWTWMYRKRHFVLAQLEKLLDVQQLQSVCGYNLHALPVRSRMLETTLPMPDEPVTDPQNRCHEFANQAKKSLNCAEWREKYSNQELIDHLVSASATELDIRLRYFLITQLEEMLCQGVFSDFEIYPFGSSLAGLGDSSSDLDLVLLRSNVKREQRLNFAMPEFRSERDLSQQCLSLIADILRNFLPNFSNVNRILRAHVPIIKMSFDPAPINVDISIEVSTESAHHGFIMASYLHYCISTDPVIKLFLVFVKNWSKQHGVVKSIPGNWFSNFQFLTLAIYFLQTERLIKTIQDLYANKPDNDDAGIRPTDVQLLKLIYKFFEFLVSFDFEKNAISILTGTPFAKPDFSSLFVENPIERDRNVCKNLCGAEFKKLLLQAYNTLDAMHCDNFHLADLLDPEHFKMLEKQSKQM